MSLSARYLGGVSLLSLVVCAHAADSVDDILKQTMAQGKIPGLTYAVVKNGRVVKAGALGSANLETLVPARRDTVYEIGSMTKQFTAACVLMLVDEGKLSLDDPIGKYVKDLPDIWKDISIRRLLSHTAGVKDYLGSFSISRTEYVRPEAIVEKVGAAPLDFQPGEGWSYSNTGYLLATLLVEKVSGEPLADFMKERIFKPLAMSHTGPSNPDTVIPNRARGYAWNGKAYLNTPAINPSLGTGAGFLVSTVDDLARWDAALLQGKLLKPETMAEYTKAVPLNNGNSSHYALGWFIHSDRGVSLVEHGGNTAGFSAEIYRVPSAKTSVILLTNAAGQGLAGTARQIVDTYIPSLNIETRNEVDPDPKRTLEMLVTFRQMARGRYDFGMFTPEMRNMIGTMRGASLRTGFAQLGKIIQTVRYLDGEPSGPNRVARYAFLGKGGHAVYMEVTWTPDGLISGFDSIYQR